MDARLAADTPVAQLRPQPDSFIQLWDGHDQLLMRQEVELDSDSGRGLLLVENLSTEWGAYRPEEASGKVVWVVVEAT